jgi:hypothetical protein
VRGGVGLPRSSQKLLALDTWRNALRFLAQASSLISKALFK